MKNNLFFHILIVILLQACSKSSPDNPNEQENPIEIGFEEVQEFDETWSAQAEAVRLGQRAFASDFTATGFYLPPNTPLILEVEELVVGSREPRLLIGTYSRYSAKANPTAIMLTPGTNTIQGDEHGGLLYIRYHGSPGQEPTGKIRVKFVEGHRPAPFFVLGETSNDQWQMMLDTWTEAPDVQLVSEKAIIVASREQALQYRNEDQGQLLTLVDDILEAEAAISGIDGSAPAHQPNMHRILMTESDNEGLYMAATHYRTMFHTSVTHQILTVAGVGSNGWGPWHELGHLHQQGAWTWDVTGEVTVNIYSLAAERALGVTPSRLVKEDRWTQVQTYFSLPDDERDYNTNAANLFVRLAMFQQLWLAFGDEFYQELHKQTREEQPAVNTRDEKMRYFMLKACTISKTDLSMFFKKWGFKTNNTVYSEIAALGLPEPTIDPTTLTDNE